MGITGQTILTPWVALVAFLPLLWLAFCLLSRRLVTGPRAHEDGVGGGIDAGFAMIVLRAYAYLFHRLRVRARENIPDSVHPGPLIVVSNHTAGIDPLLIQAACRFEIRWMMANEMQVPWAAPLWTWLRVIGVNSDRQDARAALEAIRHLRSGGPGEDRGGPVGVFPEGGIERPPGVLRPFMPGPGLLAARTGAVVLPVVVRGTPQCTTAWGSLIHRGHATVTFLPRMAWPAGTRPDRINDDLAAAFRREMGGTPTAG